MTSFLITFKPAKESPKRGWPLESLQKLVQHHRTGMRVTEPWRFHNRKEVSRDDRIFLLLQGKHGPAIIGYGKVVGGPKNKKERWRMIEFDALVDPVTEALANREDLLAIDENVWRSQASGVRLPDSVATKLERLVVGKPPTLSSSALRTLGRNGARFGDVLTNRRVERAAITAIKKQYQSEGWKVESKEAECLGYDLFCTRATTIRHIEAKGVRGSICSFVITTNEKRAAEIDNAFRLVAVTNALESEKRKLVTFTGKELLREFDFSPISFIARPRRGHG
jgi:hypothetical protein